MSVVLDSLLRGLAWWLIPGLVVISGAFPRFVAQKNRPPVVLRLPGLRRLLRGVPQRARERVEPVQRAGLAGDALARAELLENHRPFLRVQIFIGRAVMLVLCLVPLLVVVFDSQVRRLPAATLTGGAAALVAAAVLLPLFLTLAVSIVLSYGRVDRLWPLEMLVWLRFRDLLIDETHQEPWWRGRISRRAINLSNLIEALELDLLQFRGARRDESRVVPDVMRVVAAFEKRSDETASNPSSELGSVMVVAALDAWILGRWKDLPGDEVTPTLVAARSSRSSRLKDGVIAALSALALLAVVAIAYFAFGQKESTVVIGSVVSLVVAILLGPLKTMLEQRRGGEE